MKLNKKYFLSAIAATMVAPAFADTTGYYVLGNLGSARPNVGQSTFDGQLANAGATTLGSSWDSSDLGWKAQLGYQFNPNFAMEGGYINLGKVNYSATYDQGTATGDYKVDGFNIAALGIIPLDNNFSLFGKVGLVDARVSADLNGSGLGGIGNGSFSETRWRPEYGVGGIYSLSKDTDLRIEYERVNGVGDVNTTGQANVDLVSLGISYKF
jgi:OOP family OmpA-OmpF porin